VDDADGFAPMPLALGQRAPHSAVEGLDGRIEDPSRRVEMAGTKGVGITGKPGPREGESFRGCRSPELGGHLVGLQRLVIAIAPG
jgi:hypothetical protein